MLLYRLQCRLLLFFAAVLQEGDDVVSRRSCACQWTWCPMSVSLGRVSQLSSVASLSFKLTWSYRLHVIPRTCRVSTRWPWLRVAIIGLLGGSASTVQSCRRCLPHQPGARFLTRLYYTRRVLMIRPTGRVSRHLGSENWIEWIGR